MSDIAITRPGSADGAFKPATVILMILVGMLAFAATLVLGAYAPDLRSGRNGGSHALSNGATGFTKPCRTSSRAVPSRPAVTVEKRLFCTGRPERSR